MKLGHLKWLAVIPAIYLAWYAYQNNVWMIDAPDDYARYGLTAAAYLYVVTVVGYLATTFSNFYDKHTLESLLGFVVITGLVAGVARFTPVVPWLTRSLYSPEVAATVLQPPLTSTPVRQNPATRAPEARRPPVARPRAVHTAYTPMVDSER